jgi:hypothetical protein
MKARKVAAQYAAYTWYQENHKDQKSQSQAVRFAKQNWTSFLSVADVGWGRLLIRIASERAKRKGRQGRNRYHCLAS